MYVHIWTCMHMFVCVFSHVYVLMHTPRQGHFGSNCFCMAEMSCSVPLLCWKRSFFWLTREEWPVLAWQQSFCSATFLWHFFLDTASQKGSARAARSKPAGSICGDQPSRLGVQALNPKLWVLYVEPSMGLVSGCQEDVQRSQSVIQDGGGELGTPVSYTQ